jgi:GMP synthase (glutamine-hydrolysing)
MRESRFAGRRKIAWALLACAVCGLTVLVAVLCMRAYTLHGLLLDLELESPDPARHEQLRKALTQRLPAEASELAGWRICLDYCHFSACTESSFDRTRIDFLVLSPQGTPWYMYKGEAAEQLDRVKRFLRHAILRQDLPVLGVCGGHQFLALAFGGEVGFIDPSHVGTFPPRYPKEATSERGVVFLTTLGEDPIFRGVVTHPGRFRAVESHYEEVKRVPERLVNLAYSDMSWAQIIRVPEKQVYGLAFHPERCWDIRECEGNPVPEGRQILLNFLGMVIQKRP